MFVTAAVEKPLVFNISVNELLNYPASVRPGVVSITVFVIRQTTSPSVHQTDYSRIRLKLYCNITGDT